MARLLVDMVLTDKYGIYHATNEGICNWYEFACEIFRQAAYDKILLQCILHCQLALVFGLSVYVQRMALIVGLPRSGTLRILPMSAKS